MCVRTRDVEKSDTNTWYQIGTRVYSIALCSSIIQQFSISISRSGCSRNSGSRINIVRTVIQQYNYYYCSKYPRQNVSVNDIWRGHGGSAKKCPGNIVMWVNAGLCTRENNLFMQIDESVYLYFILVYIINNTHCTRRIDYSQTETSICMCTGTRYMYFKLPINLYIIASAAAAWPRIETFSEYVIV